jgi:hypothetical protein
VRDVLRRRLARLVWLASPAHAKFVGSVCGVSDRRSSPFLVTTAALVDYTADSDGGVEPPPRPRPRRHMRDMRARQATAP